ncbi:MAG: glycosyltransferase family protein, partial [Calditrichia bacterium]
MSTIAGVIQARMGSSRLPGKSLSKIYNGLSLLEMVILRVMKARKLDMIILATSKENNCDPLVELADRMGIFTVRGSEMDVLSRFVDAIQIYKPDVVVRICADNPFIDPGEIDKLVNFFQKNQFDYAVNNIPECGLPDGLGCEIVRADVLLRVAEKTHDNHYREHVTNYITNHREDFTIGWLHAERNLWYPDLKLDIDCVEDLEKMRAFCVALPDITAPYWTANEIIDYARSIVHD